MKNIINELKENNKKLVLFYAKYKNIEGWFTDDRIKVPKKSDIYRYEIRSDDDGTGDPVKISTKVLVNFYGTFLTKEKLNLSLIGLTGFPYDNIEESDLNIDYSVRLEIFI